jgi:DNA-binding phage protein
VLVAAYVASALSLAIKNSGQNMTEVADGLHVARSTVYDVLRGTTFPDFVTIVNAEIYFGRSLWPKHVKRG